MFCQYGVIKELYNKQKVKNMKLYLVNTMAECIETTANIIKPYKKFSDKPCFLFCEDKTTLNVEYSIALKEGGFFGVEVLTFRRYIKTSGINASLLSKEASVMLVRKILVELESELKCFSNNVYRPNLALNIYETLSQLESAKVTPEILKSLLNENRISEALKNKISDLYLIFNEYNNYLEKNGYLDSNSYLSLALGILKSDENIRGAQVILSGFNSLTKQRAEIIDALNEITDDLSLVILANEKSEIYTNEMLTKIKQLYNGVEVIPSKLELNKEASIIQRALYSPKVFREDYKAENTKNVTVYEAVSPNTEAQFIAKEILKEIRNGKRFKNLAVAVGNLNEYASLISKTFSEYGIPFYIDRPSTLLEHPISSFIINYLNLVKKGFSVSDFIRYTSSALLNTDKEVLDGLKNYILKNAFTRKNLKEPFKNADKNLEVYENIRSLVYSLYQAGEKAKTVGEYIYAVKDMLLKTNAYKNLEYLGAFMAENGERKIKEINDKIPEKIENILTEMEFILGDSKISALDFKSIFLSGVTGTEIEVVPLFNDAVFVGAISDVKIKNADVLYFMGLNGDIPSSKSDTALLNDTDLLKLDEFKVIVEPKIKIVNKRERENVGTGLIAFNEKLVLSYSANSMSGSEIFKSEIISYILKAFNVSTLKESSLNKSKIDENEENIARIFSGFTSEKTALKEILLKSNGFDFKNPESGKLTALYYQAVEELGLNSYKENADVLYDKIGSEKALNIGENEYFLDNNTSASALERYFECPYKAYASNLLKLSERETGDLKVYETGNVLHALIESYVKNIDKVIDESTSNSLVEKLFKEIIQDEEYNRYLNKPIYEHTFKNLEKEGKRVCYEVYQSLKKSKFKPFKEELEFGDNAEFAPIILNTKKGEYKIRGKIDRVDKFDNNVRIIDYKTGKIEKIDSSFYVGLKIQLYLYLNAFNNSEYNPVGSYYFPVHDKYSEENEKNYVMHGKTVNDADIITATDKNLLESKSSDVVSIKIKKDGNPYATSEVLSEDELKSYMKYAIKLSEKAVDEMNSGFIKPTPYKDKCKYCNYGGMCGFCIDSDAERNVTGVSKNTIVKAVEDAENGGENNG